MMETDKLVVAFTVKEANDLALLLRVMPAPLKVIEERNGAILVQILFMMVK